MQDGGDTEFAKSGNQDWLDAVQRQKYLEWKMKSAPKDAAGNPKISDELMAELEGHPLMNKQPSKYFDQADSKGLTDMLQQHVPNSLFEDANTWDTKSPDTYAKYKSYFANGGYLDIEGPQEYMKDGGDAATLEVEGGEVIMPMGGSIADTTLYGGAKATNVSPVAYKVEGASHQQTNAAGTKGVPVKADSELYVFTDRLDIDGRENPSKSIAKTANKINKSIVDMMKNPLDKYGNNDVAMQDMQQELLILQKKNDQAKFLKEARKILTSKDGGIFDKFIDHVVKNKPEEMGTGNMGDTSSTLDPAMMVEGQVEGQNPMAAMNQAPMPEEAMMAHGGKYQTWKRFQEGGQYVDESLMTPQERFRRGLYNYQDGGGMPLQTVKKVLGRDIYNNALEANERVKSMQSLGFTEDEIRKDFFPKKEVSKAPNALSTNPFLQAADLIKAHTNFDYSENNIPDYEVASRLEKIPSLQHLGQASPEKYKKLRESYAHGAMDGVTDTQVHTFADEIGDKRDVIRNAQARSLQGNMPLVGPELPIDRPYSEWPKELYKTHSANEAIDRSLKTGMPLDEGLAQREVFKRFTTQGTGEDDSPMERHRREELLMGLYKDHSGTTINDDDFDWNKYREFKKDYQRQTYTNPIKNSLVNATNAEDDRRALEAQEEYFRSITPTKSQEFSPEWIKKKQQLLGGTEAEQRADLKRLQDSYTWATRIKDMPRAAYGGRLKRGFM